MTERIANIIDNLPLLADLGFASVLVALPTDDGGLNVVASWRSTTAVAPTVSDLEGKLLEPDRQPEAFAALQGGQGAVAQAVREREGIGYRAHAHPVFAAGAGDGQAPIAVIVRLIAQAAVENPGRMEAEFLDMATAITDELCRRPLTTTGGAAFSTTRRPGDGVLRVDSAGVVVYPSPNAVAIMRRAGFEERVRTSPVSALPGGGFAVTPVLGTHTALEREVEVLGRNLHYRALALSGQDGEGQGAVVFVEDVTELRRQQAELASRDEIINEIRQQVQTLSDQLETRKVLDRAKAILIERGLTEAQAFNRLQKSAMNHRKTMREICEAIILSEELN